ncbi:U-box domain-containing protein 27 [Linum grandiflorum]
MKSPVSLSTGVTYDRSSIQRWLDAGNNTCPATMQVLDSKEFVPNHNLQPLIRIWSDNVPSPSTAAPSNEQIQLAVKDIENKDSRRRSLLKIASFAEESEENRTLLAKMDGFVARIANLVACTDGGGDLESVEVAQRWVAARTTLNRRSEVGRRMQMTFK